MNCTRLRQMLDAWLDGEVDRATADEVTQHLAGCTACAAIRNERDALGKRVRAGAPRYSAPAEFRNDLRRALAANAPRDAIASRARRTLTWLQAGAIAACVAVVSALGGYWLARPQPDNPLREQVVASHVASLGASRRLVDVASDDRHTVKPWFQGRVDFSPPVRDLSKAGFTLLGARLDHIGDRQASAIVYRIRNHPVNLFTWRATGSEPEAVALTTARGFGVATWSDGGLRYAAVSDVDARDLARFAQLIRAQP
jgi:anti-sigma factor RsiW